MAPETRTRPTLAPPLLVAIKMGYGHMRPAAALGAELGVPVLACDQAPLASAKEVAIWRRARGLYEWGTRCSTTALGRPLRPLVRSATDIVPLHPRRDLSKATWPVRRFAKSIRKGLGDGLCEELRASGRPLLTTYFGPAHAADAGGIDQIYVVATDSDLHRIWAPRSPQKTRIHYCVPSRRAGARLEAYGVPPAQVHFTGFPLPPELLGGRDLSSLKQHLTARLVRLDPTGVFRRSLAGPIETELGTLPAEPEGQAPLLTFAIGGAGAQARLAKRFLPSLRPLIDTGRLRVALVAGVRNDAERALRRAVERAGLTSALEAPGQGLEILKCDDLPSYFPAFNELLARTDILWTKPSELTFFGALGLPLVLARPVGTHENYNRRWACERGAGLPQPPAHLVAGWLTEWLQGGVLAQAAWNGYCHLPKRGLYRIVDQVTGASQRRTGVSGASA